MKKAVFSGDVRATSNSYDGLFYNCVNLEEVDFGSLSTANAANMSYMFMNCYKLKTIKGLEKLKTNTAGTVVGSMINELNAVNIVDSWPNTENADRLDINLETVYAAQPEMILVQCHADGELCSQMIEEQYGSNDVWKSLSAVKDGKVYYLEFKLFHYKPNSHFAEAYQKLAGILYPNVEFSFQK